MTTNAEVDRFDVSDALPSRPIAMRSKRIARLGHREEYEWYASVFVHPESRTIDLAYRTADLDLVMYLLFRYMAESGLMELSIVDQHDVRHVVKPVPWRGPTPV